MKTPEEFRSFYDRDLLPSLQALEADRKKLINGAFKWLAIGLIPWLISLAFSMGNVLESNWVFLIIGVVVSVGLYFILNLRKIREIKDRFKSEVIARMVKSIDPSLTYNASQCI